MSHTVGYPTVVYFGFDPYLSEHEPILKQPESSEEY